MSDSKNTNIDGKKFAEEYTSVTKDNVFVYRSAEEIINILEHGTGVVYLGFPECPWCTAYVPYLNEVAKANDVDKVYYYNILNDRKDNTDNYKNCTAYVKQEKEIEKGRNGMNNKVIFEKKGSLYIELNDEIGQVVAIKNQYDKIPDYVDVVFVDNTPYIKGFEPKKEKTYTRKADIKDGSK